MAEKATLARPYAKAAFGQAHAGNTLAAWSGLLAAGATLVADPRVQELLDSPRMTPPQLADFISGTLSEIDPVLRGSAIDSDGRNFIAVLAENHRLALLPEIAAMFETLRAAAENVADVQVTSAVALNDAQQQRLQSALQKRLRKTVRLHCGVNPDLVGGAIVKTGDFVIDGSLRTQLARLAEQMVH